jgi:hypothetical protein
MIARAISPDADIVTSGDDRGQKNGNRDAIKSAFNSLRNR